MNPGTVRYAQGDTALLIHRSFCKGCKICVADCPEKIIALDEHDIAVVTEIGRCIFCGICAVRCPDFAISVDRPPARWAGLAEHMGGLECA
jgi:2-oxoglutarate ferredoxin oxidoreductase subunit delta